MGGSVDNCGFYIICKLSHGSYPVEAEGLRVATLCELTPPLVTNRSTEPSLPLLPGYSAFVTRFTKPIPRGHFCGTGRFPMRGAALVRRICAHLAKSEMRPHDRVYDPEDLRCARSVVLVAFRRGRYSRSPLTVYEEAFIRCFGEHPDKLVPKWLHMQEGRRREFARAFGLKKPPQRAIGKKAKGAAA